MGNLIKKNENALALSKNLLELTKNILNKNDLTTLNKKSLQIYFLSISKHLKHIREKLEA